MLEKYIGGVKQEIGYQSETSLVIGLDFYHYGENWWLHTWGNWLLITMVTTSILITMLTPLQTHLEEGGEEPYEFMFMDVMWHSWNDYDMGAIFGVKLKDNLGVFVEGRYLYYWERPAYDIKLELTINLWGGKMKHEEIYNIVRMIYVLLMVGMFAIPSCEDNKVEEEVVLEPNMQMWVNGDQ